MYRIDNLLRSVPTIEAPSAVVRLGETKQEVVSKLEQLVVGKPVQGEILSRQADGTFFVKIAGATARMNLPEPLKTGDSVPLTLLTTNPRATFLLGSGQNAVTTTASFTNPAILGELMQELDGQGTSATSISAKQAIGLADAQKNAALATALTGSVTTNLSDAGKLIDAILHVAEQESSTAQLSKAALLPNADLLAAPEKLAASLQQAISSSGLFYESHLAQWAEGKRPLADVLREPQAQQAAQLLVNAGNASESGNKLAENSALAQLVHQQLNTLEQQRIVWQGNLAPGMPLHWEITQHQQQHNANPAEAEPSWQSVVRFELPTLGVVSATINLQAGHLQLLLRTSKEDSAALLQSRALTLADALKQAGSSLDSFSVKQDDNA